MVRNHSELAGEGLLVVLFRPVLSLFTRLELMSPRPIVALVFKPYPMQKADTLPEASGLSTQPLCFGAEFPGQSGLFPRLCSLKYAFSCGS